MSIPFGELAIFLVSATFQALNLFENQPSRPFVVPTFLNGPQNFQQIATLISVSNFFPVSAPPTNICAEVIGYIIESDQYIVIALRGPDTCRDQCADASFFNQTSYNLVPNSGNVQSAYFNMYTFSTPNQPSLRTQILSTLASLDPSKTLYVTGNAIGAALATLATLDIAVNSPFNNPRMINFASHKVGDPEFATSFNQKIQCGIRVVNQYDVIPILSPPDRLGNPLTGLILYEHVGNCFPIAINSLDPICNSETTSAYFPGLNQLFPSETQLICNANPTGFCPIGSFGKPCVSTCDFLANLQSPDQGGFCTCGTPFPPLIPSSVATRINRISKN